MVRTPVRPGRPDGQTHRELRRNRRPLPLDSVVQQLLAVAGALSAVLNPALVRSGRGFSCRLLERLVFTPDALPAPLVPVLEQVRSWSGRDGAAAAACSPQQRAAWLAGVRQLVDAAEAVFTTTLATFDTHGDGETLHAAGSTTAWLQGALHLAAGDASGRVQAARSSRTHLRKPMKALAAGGVTFDQVRAIDRAIRRLPDQAQPSAVELLTELATRVDAGQVRVAGRHLQHTLNPDGALAEADKQFERRYLHLSPLLDGMTAIDGLLDAEAATTISTALAPFLVPAGRHDERSAAQRRADGLIEVARAAMDAGKLPELSGQPAQLQVLVPLATLANPVTDSRTNTSGCPEPASLPESPGGTSYLTAPTLERISCHVLISRVLLNADSIPIDLGRSQRLFTPTQKRALTIRDGGCRFPDCNRPARYTDAHHIIAWTQGGTTDLPNGLLLCRHHHRIIHGPDWHIRVHDPDAGANSQVWFEGPDQQSLPSHPRGP